MINLTIFNNSLFEAGTEFFNQLGIRLNSNTASSLGAKELLKDHYKDKGIFKAIDEAYFLGLVDDSVFDGNAPLLNKEKISLKEAEDRLTAEYNGLMVFAVRLKDSYLPTRGEIADLTRAFNRVSKSVPVVLLLKYGGLLSFAASERTKYKQAWREGEKIGKISLLKDIKVAAPHTGHLKILDDLKVAPAVTDFNALYKQWQEVFNVQLLNKKFYQELANWYFWALQNVEFPEDAEKNKDVRNAISVIRMITRLIFIWFVKEKGLIPDDLFNEVKVREILVGADGVRPDSGTSTKAGACHAPLQANHSTYYKAILQNLFFATLNTEMNKDKPGSRKFRGKNKGDGRDQHYMIHNVFRYEDYFASPQDTLKKYFENIPFLNGGLFECLDKIIASNSKDKIIRIDGFSDHPKNILKVPDYLFFSSEQSIDLNEVYGTKNKTYKVRGIIDILDSYKFTVDENTPIEEEIALDPELLGKVFENLLASYNPETQTTARKQTGSFYTPREIVNYMVDESIIAYLANALDNAPALSGTPSLAKRGEGELGSHDARLRHLVAYNDDLHKFTSDEVDVLIAAINTLKGLDPACGSGAFPMGMLHKLVYILGKLDPDNSKWRELQRQKAIKETEEAYNIGDKEEREKRLLDISEVFENNASDYGRKLYLIENCIFGVDIQPIAVQIAKLRFFVSLIVDQRIDPKKENLGVRPLPNLETKFVAANTLIGIEKPEQMLLRNPEIDKKEKELKEVRERHFTARTPQTKEKYRKEDERLRAEISKLLKKDGFPRETTEKLAKWNPYDQNAHADFFDMEWMFGIIDGFDIVIGNPPYVQLQKDGGNLADMFKNCGYISFERTGDIYALFYENGINILKTGGHLCFITSNKWMRAGYGKKLRKFFNLHNPLLLVDLGPGIFENATVDTNILIIGKKNNQGQFAGITLNEKAKDAVFSDFINNNKNILPKMGDDAWFIGNQAEQNLKEKIERIGKPLKDWDVKIYFGIKTGLNQAFIIDTATRDRLIAEDPKSTEILKPILRGRDIKRYGYEWAELWLIASDFDIDVPKLYPAVFKHLKQFEEKAKNRDDQGKNWWNLRSCAYYPEFKKDKVVWKRIGSVLRFGFDIHNMYCQDSTCIMTGSQLKYLCAFMNSKLGYQMLYDKAPKTGTGDVIVSVQALEPLLIPPITPSNKGIVERIERIVDQILSAKKQPPSSPFSKGELPVADTSALEKQIDEIVYALYGLTPEEIAIVEGKK